MRSAVSVSPMWLPCALRFRKDYVSQYWFKGESAGNPYVWEQKSWWSWWFPRDSVDFAFSHSQVVEGPPQKKTKKIYPLNRMFQVRELVALRAKVLELETEAVDAPVGYRKWTIYRLEIDKHSGFPYIAMWDYQRVWIFVFATSQTLFKHTYN
jgi:hypothetical protein